MNSRLIVNPNYPRLGDEITNLLNNAQNQHTFFGGAVAFAKMSGVMYLLQPLHNFLEQGHHCELIIGIDQFGTSYEALRALTELGPNLRCYINYCIDTAVTFHPKFYFFEGEEHAIVITGSGNFTRGGLYTNDEISMLQVLDLSIPTEQNLLASVKASFTNMTQNNAILVTREVLDSLVASGKLLSEASIASITPSSRGAIYTATESNAAHFDYFFRSVLPRQVPFCGFSSQNSTPIPSIPLLPVAPIEERGRLMGFAMTLQRTDVGTGQVSLGTARRSPEIFIPLQARNFHPDFWGWMSTFSLDETHPGKYDRRVRVLFHGEAITVAMMTWPDKSDFRLRSEQLRRAADIGDILRIEPADVSSGVDYCVEIIKRSDAQFIVFNDICNQTVRNSEKRWGYYSI